MPVRRQSGAASSRQCMATERQKVTATKDPAGSSTTALMEEVLHRENLGAALKRVCSNKGAPGIDGMTVDELTGYLRQEWPRLKEELLSGTYEPLPVRVVDIPKPNGGTRMLGIPTVLDRTLQQAILQVIGPIFDATFSDASYGFRRGRSAHQAVARAREYISAGCRFVVDLDLENFFDRVNHDILMSRVARRVEDKRLLRLIRRYLMSGLMVGGVVSPRTAGTPQGGPLSPLLSNVLLDDLDKELEKRGHSFVRYADDANVYVRSQKAGARVMASVTHFLECKLQLRVNRVKSTVGRPWKLKFLGYSVTIDRAPRLKPAPESVKRVKGRIRQIMRRGRGRNIQVVIEELNAYLRGWFGYFRMAEVKQVFDLLDQWIRRHLRQLMWLRWNTPKKRRQELRKLGIGEQEAQIATSTGRGSWWCSSSPAMQGAISKDLLTRWGLVSLDQMRRRQARAA